MSGNDDNTSLISGNDGRSDVPTGGRDSPDRDDIAEMFGDERENYELEEEDGEDLFGDDMDR